MLHFFQIRLKSDKANRKATMNNKATTLINFNIILNLRLTVFNYFF